MAAKICIQCGFPFSQGHDEEICPTCKISTDAVFQRIKEYLYEHPGASATELVMNLGVTLKQIRIFLRDERLDVVGSSATGMKCDRCGRSIQTGRVCEACALEPESQRTEGRLPSSRIKVEAAGEPSPVRGELVKKTHLHGKRHGK